MHVRTHGIALWHALALALLIASCSSASTAIVTPTSDKCQVGVANNPSSFGAPGGAGSVVISTTRDCTWSVAADAVWVSITGDHSGQGEAVVAYAVAVNTIPAPRSGFIAVGTQKVQLSQAAAPCRFDVSHPRDSIGAAGGRLAVDVTTVTGCSWSATSSSGWIAVASGQTGNSSGTVGLAVAANAGLARVGIVNVAGQSYTVAQDAVRAPSPTPAPPPNPAPTPPPSPPPSPPPPPPAPIPVHVDGTVSGLLGSCPDITFTAASRLVVAGRITSYVHGRCADVSNGDVLTIDGTRSGNTVDATHIDLKGQR